MVLDGDDLLELPIIGDRLKKSSAATPTARGMMWHHIIVGMWREGILFIKGGSESRALTTRSVVSCISLSFSFLRRCSCSP